MMPPAPVRPKVLRPIAFPDLNTSEISTLVFSPDGRHLACGYGTDAEVSLWNLETGRLAWQRYVNAASGGPIQFGPNGKFLVADFYDPDAYTPTIVSGMNGELLPRFADLLNRGNAYLENEGWYLVVERGQGHVGKQRFMDSVNHKSMACSTEAWDTRIWYRTDHVAFIPKYPVSLTPAGKIVSGPMTSKPQGLLDAAGNPAGEWWKHTAPPKFDNGDTASQSGIYVSVSDNGDYLYGKQNGEITVWDLRREKRLWAAATPGDSVRAPTISPDGRTLAVVTLQGSVCCWSLLTGRLLFRTHCSQDVLRCAAFSANGRVLAVAGGELNEADGVRLLDMRSHTLLAVLKVGFPEFDGRVRKDWSLDHPDWLASLPDLSYVASKSIVRKIRTPGRERNARIVKHFERPERVRAALRKCYEGQAGNRP